MNAYHFGAPCVSGKACRARDRIRRDSFDKLHYDTNTSYSIPQPATNINDISPSYNQDYASTSIPQQSPLEKIATSSNKSPSRTCSSSPQEQGSSQRGTTVDPRLQAASHDPQRDRPTFGLGTTLRESSSIPNRHLSPLPMHEISTTTTDNSINNANIPDNRVNNGQIKIGNSSSRVLAYSNDIINIGTIQCHVWMPLEPHNPEPPPVSRSRTRKRRCRRPKHEDRSRTIWERLWCFY